MIEKLFLSINEINSIVFSFAQAMANNNVKAGTSITNNLAFMWNRFVQGKLDVEDYHVLYNALETCRLTLLKPETEAEPESMHELFLEASEIFNRISKLYHRQSSI